MLVTVCAVVFWCNHYGILMLNVCHESIDHGVTLLTRLMWNVNTKWWDPNVCVCVFFF